MHIHQTCRWIEEDNLQAAGRFLNTYSRFESICTTQLSIIHSISKVGTGKTVYRLNTKLFEALNISLHGTPLIPNLHQIATSLPKRAKSIDKMIERLDQLSTERNWLISEYPDLTKKRGLLARLFFRRSQQLERPIPYSVDELHAWTDEVTEMMLDLANIIDAGTHMSIRDTMGLEDAFKVVSEVKGESLGEADFVERQMVS